MSKNKFFQKLLLGGLCALTATAMIGVTACKDGKDPEEESGHVHNYATGDNWSSDENGHWYACLNSGHTEAYTKTAHTDEDENGKCDVCGWDMSAEQEKPTAYATEKIAVDISKLTDISAGGELVKNSGIYATSAMTLEDKARSIIYNGNEIKTTKWLKTDGTIAKNEKSLKFEIENDNSVIVVYASSGSNGTERFLTIKKDGSNGTLAEVEGQKKQTIGKGNNLMGTAIFEVNKGTYYVGSADSGVNIAYIAVWENGKLKEEALETKEETAATCTTPGNIAYTKTNFGRFLNAKGESVAEETVTSPALGHLHEADMTTLQIPTKTETGSVNVLCSNNHAHDFEAELPELTSDKYTKVTDGQEAGKALYGYAVPDTVNANGEKVTVTFVADNVAEIQYKYETKFSNILNGTVPIGKANATALAEGISIYGMTNNSNEVTAWDSTYTVTADGNTLTVSDKGYSGGTKKSAFAFILFDNAITSGVYRITGSISLSNFGNGTANNSTTGNWCPLQLISNDSTNAADTFAALRTGAGKELGLGNSTENGNLAGTGLEYTAGTDYEFVLLVDLDRKEVTLTLSINNKDYKETVSITAEKWTGFKLQTADSADRTVVLKNLVISQRVVDEG